MLAAMAQADPPHPDRLPGHRHDLPAPGVLANMAATVDHISDGGSSSGSARRGTRWSATPTASRCRR